MTGLFVCFLPLPIFANSCQFLPILAFLFGPSSSANFCLILPNFANSCQFLPIFANSCQFLPLLKDTLGTIRQELSKIGKNWQKLATLRKSQRTLSFSHSAHLLIYLQIWTVKLSFLKYNCSFLGKYMDFKTNDGENTYVAKI